MTQAPPAPPHARPLPEPQALDLDERIQRAEQRLVARDVGLRHDLQAWTTQLRGALHPRRLLMPVVAGVCLTWAGWQLLRGAPKAGAKAGAARASPGGAGGWSRFVGLAWPAFLAARRAGVGVSMLKRAASRQRPRAHRPYPGSEPSA